jgi:hypothetical protein
MCMVDSSLNEICFKYLKVGKIELSVVMLNVVMLRVVVPGRKSKLQPDQDVHVVQQEGEEEPVAVG